MLLQTSHSNSSLATGSSRGSLQTTLEEGFGSPGDPMRPLICRTHVPPPGRTQRPRAPQTALNLQATRGRQRTRSRHSDCTVIRRDSTEPSDEDTGVRPGQVGNPEQLSDNLSSFSLTSLHPPDSLAPPLAKKCNSTGSLVVQNKDGRCLIGFNPWTEATSEETETETKTCRQTVGSRWRKNR